MPRWFWLEKVDYAVFKLQHYFKLYPHWTWDEMVDAVTQDREEYDS